MSDRRFERDAAGDIDEIIDVEMPSRHSGRAATGVGPKPSGKARARTLLFVGLAGGLAAVAVMALSDYRPVSSTPPPSVDALVNASASPSPSPSPVLMASTEPSVDPNNPSPAPTLGPDWPSLIDIPVLSIPADQTRTVADPYAVAPAPASPSASPDAAVGPFLYGFGGAEAGSVSGLDIGTGDQFSIKLPVNAHTTPVAAMSDGNWLVAVMRDDRTTCATRQPWRIFAAHLGSDGRLAPGGHSVTELAHGTSIGRKAIGDGTCRYAFLPQIAVADGRVAWTEERAGGKASVVHVQSLGPGQSREYVSHQYVVELVLSSSAVAWLETDDPVGLQLGTPSGGQGSNPSWRIKEADPLDATAPAHLVDVGRSADPADNAIAEIQLAGSTVIASVISRDGSNSRVVAVADGVRTTVADSAQGRLCVATSTVGLTVLLRCAWTSVIVDIDGASQTLTLPVVWTAGGGLRALAVGNNPPVYAFSIAAGDQWVILNGTGGFTAFPASALSAH
jgi:hypothetical protein